MGGVLYSFDATFDPNKHQEEFDKAIKKLGKEGTSVKEQLEAEWEAVITGLLSIYPVIDGVKNMQSNLKDFKLVVVSTSLVKTSELILEKIGLGKRAWMVFDMSEFGSKKDTQAWKAIFQQLPTVDVIVEDGKKNLTVAEQAARELGFSPKVFKEVPILDI